MKTQSLLFTAAALCLGATSAFGAVSSNIVGYTKLSLNQGLNLIANTLDNKSGNHIADVLSAVPDGTFVFQFDGTKYNLSQGFVDSGAVVWTEDFTLNPGTGFFIQMPTAASVTFVGEVLQGSLSNPVPKGLSIKSSQVPQAGAMDTLGLAAGDGDSVFVFANNKYTLYQFFSDDGGVWTTDDGKAPQLAIGQAVFYQSGGAATWNRTFTVN